jgi:uncharacterized membrane protein YagU involved in acid resistance
MNVLGAIIAGLAGTAVMTMLMYAAPLMGMPKMDIAGMLGSMFVSKKETATIVGLVLHFMMGVVFAIIYALLWSLGIGSATWWWGLIFGAVHTVVILMMMPIMMRMHPRPPEMAGGPMVMVGQLMGHLVFGLVVALVYSAF